VSAPEFHAAASAAIDARINFRGADLGRHQHEHLSIDRPAGTAANDVLVAAISVRPSSSTITPPSGWTLVRRVNNTAGQTSSLAVYRKVAGSSEPSTFSWDVSGAAYAAGGLQAFANVDTVNPINVENGQATVSSLSHATPSISTTVANAMIVTAHSFTTSTTWMSRETEN
jgi:hypothetical protein